MSDTPQYELDDHLLLKRVTKYALVSTRSSGVDTGGFSIEVYEHIQPKFEDTYFTAIPTSTAIFILGQTTLPSFCGNGPTEQEALADCLRKVKGKSYEEIFPEKEGAK